MSFQIEEKVALISGGASGLGLQYAKELLTNGLKGVTLADISEEFGKKALQEIEEEFGPKKAIFVKTDVTSRQSYEEAFKKTIDSYKNLDILINNAGILNDSIWEKEITININGTVHGTLLALEEYVPKYRSGPEGVIVNISSIAGVLPIPSIPIYTATKFAIVGLSKSFALHYNRTKVKVLTLCPGSTATPLLLEIRGRNLGPDYDALIPDLDTLHIQRTEHVAKTLVRMIKDAKTGTAWVVEEDREPSEFVLPPRQSEIYYKQ